MLETGLAGGVLGTDKAADLFKEFTLRITDGSKSSEDALGELSGAIGDVSVEVGDARMPASQFFQDLAAGKITGLILFKPSLI